MKKCLFHQILPIANIIENLEGSISSGPEPSTFESDWLTTRASEVSIFTLNYLNWNLGSAQIDDEDAIGLSQLTTEPFKLCARDQRPRNITLTLSGPGTTVREVPETGYIQNEIGHFRVLLCHCFKTSLSAKPFISK